jgi:hypothetical protein
MAINLSKLIRRASADFLVNVAVINSVTGDGFIDPNVEGSYTETAQTRHIEQGLLTYAADAKQQLRPPGESRQKQWMTQVMCDLVIDFMPEVDLSGDNVRFLVNGEEYAQKDTGNEITDFYTRAGNETLLRTVALFRTGRIEGRICYTSSSVQTDLYHYDLAAQKFSWANPTAPAGVATIGPGNDGNLIEFYVANADGSDSTLSMYVDPAGAVHAADMIATGSFTNAPMPRLDFYVGQSQIAALCSNGVLYLRNFTASANMPVGRKDEIEFFAAMAPDNFAAMGGAMNFDPASQWLFGLRAVGLFAPAIVQGL